MEEINNEYLDGIAHDVFNPYASYDPPQESHTPLRGILPISMRTRLPVKNAWCKVPNISMKSHIRLTRKMYEDKKKTFYDPPFPAQIFTEGYQFGQLDPDHHVDLTIDALEITSEINVNREGVKALSQNEYVDLDYESEDVDLDYESEEVPIYHAEINQAFAFAITIDETILGAGIYV